MGPVFWVKQWLLALLAPDRERTAVGLLELVCCSAFLVSIILSDSKEFFIFHFF